MKSLERIQRTAAEILAAVMANQEPQRDTTGGEACAAVAA